jgi:paraquat-inducible protein A
MRRALPLVLLAATICFPLGVVLPLISVERLFVFTDEPSLVGMVHGLWSEGDLLLSALIALFSLVFPTFKLALLHMAAYGPEGSTIKLPGWLKALSNWSMLDVVLVAIVIFAAKTSGLATAFARPGLWFFAVSVVLTAAATATLRRAQASG